VAADDGALVGRGRREVSGSALVLVDDAAENVVTEDLAVAGGRGPQAGEWLVELNAAVRPTLVVMADVLDEHGLEMSLRDNEEVVETVLSDGPHESLGKGVRLR
jgi:hypothetical protein